MYICIHTYRSNIIRLSRLSSEVKVSISAICFRVVRARMHACTLNRKNRLELIFPIPHVPHP